MTKPVFLRSETFQFKQLALTLLGDKYTSVGELEGEIIMTASGSNENAPKIVMLPESSEPEANTDGGGRAENEGTAE